MPRYEYKVVPAPRTPAKARGVRGDGPRFALTIEETINASASDGWEYLRSETLPCEHRGWFSRRTEEQTVLIFRRTHGAVEDDVPAMPSAVASQAHSRLAADRGPRRPASFSSLRAARPTEPDHERT